MRNLRSLLFLSLLSMGACKDDEVLAEELDLGVPAEDMSTPQDAAAPPVDAPASQDADVPDMAANPTSDMESDMKPEGKDA